MLLVLVTLGAMVHSSEVYALGEVSERPAKLVFLPANDGILDEPGHVELRIYANQDVVGISCDDVMCSESKVLGKGKMDDVLAKLKKGSRLFNILVNAGGRLPAIVTYVRAMVLAGNAAVSDSALDSPLGIAGALMGSAVCIRASSAVLGQVLRNGQCFKDLRAEVEGIKTMAAGNLVIRHARGNHALLESLVASLF